MKQSKTNKDLSLVHNFTNHLALLVCLLLAARLRARASYNPAAVLPDSSRPPAAPAPHSVPPLAAPAPWLVLRATPPLPLPARPRLAARRARELAARRRRLPRRGNGATQSARSRYSLPTSPPSAALWKFDGE